MANRQQTSSAGTGWAVLLFLIFLGLKLGGVVGWSWWWVTAPLWIGTAFAVAVLALILLFAVVVTVVKAVIRG